MCSSDLWVDDRGIDQLMLADGLEGAFLGVIHDPRTKLPVAVYDYDTVLTLLQQQDMTRTEAEEYFSFNVEGAYMGLQTPVFLQRFTPRVRVH